MKRKVLSLFLSLSMLLSIPVGAKALPESKHKVLTSPRTVPAAVFDEPYAYNEWLTRYAPWMDNFHLRSQWEIDNGLYGGEANQQMRVLTMSPVDSDVMYFASDCAGFYRTTDGGKNWFNINEYNPSREAYGLLADKFDRETVYAGVRKLGFCRSHDLGKTWELLAEDTYSKNSRRSGMLAQDGVGNTYIGIGSGIYRLDRETDEVENLFEDFAQTNPDFKLITELKGDSGVVWYDVDVSPDGQSIYGIARGGTDDVVKGVYVSRDGGKTWEIITTVKEGESEFAITCAAIAIHPENPNLVYTSIQFKDKESGVKLSDYALYKTEDCFKTLIAAGETQFSEDDTGVTTNAVAHLKLTFGPKNADGIYPIYYAGDLTAYPLRESLDDGKTFTPVGKDYPFGVNTPRGIIYKGYQSQGFAVDMNEPGRIVFCQSGVHVREADGTIKWMNSGFSGANVDDIAFNSKYETFMATCDLGGYVHESGTWTEDSFPVMYRMKDAYNDDYLLAVFDPNDDNHIVTHLGKSNSTPPVYGIRQSFDKGKTFEPINTETAIPKEEIVLGNPQVLQYDDEDPNIIYSSYSNSYDNGKTWVKNEYVIMAISPVDDHKWVARKGTEKSSDIYYTTDAGKTWTFVCNYNMHKVTGFFLDGNNDDYLWFAGRYTLSRMNIKTAEVESFNSHFSGLPHFQNVKQNPKDYNHIIVTSLQAGTPENDWFLAETRDGGKTWSVVPRIWGSSSRMILFPEHLDYAIIGTMGGLMIYRYKEFWKYQDSRVQVTVDDKEMDFSTAAVIENNRVMVPLRDLMEELDAEVKYDYDAHTVTIRKGDRYIHLTPGSSEAIIDGRKVLMDAVPYITEKGVTMASIRFVAEALDINVGWSEEERMVVVATK